MGKPEGVLSPEVTGTVIYSGKRAEAVLRAIGLTATDLMLEGGKVNITVYTTNSPSTSWTPSPLSITIAFGMP